MWLYEHSFGCGRLYRCMPCCFHAVSWDVLGQPVSYLALLAYCATDFSLDSHGSKSSCWPFPPTLLKTCVFLLQLVVGRVRLRKTAFRHWLVLLRVVACPTRISQRSFGLWAGAMQVSGVDFGGCGVWTEQQLWSKGTSSGTADLQWKPVDLLKEREALGRFWCSLSLPRRSPQNGCARLTAA